MKHHALAAYLFALVVTLNHRLGLGLSVPELTMIGAVLGLHLSPKLVEGFRAASKPS